MAAREGGTGPARLVLTSPAFQEGRPVPVRHTCDGDDVSPVLTWTGVPVETRGFVLICDDPDAPRGTWVHWLLYNLPAEATALEEAVPTQPELPSGARQGINDAGDVGYGGPCPPPGKPHRYFFRLHALDTLLTFPPGVHRPELDRAMAGHILARGTLMGTYQRHG